MTSATETKRRTPIAFAVWSLALLLLVGLFLGAAHTHGDDDDHGSTCTACRQIDSAAKIAPDGAVAPSVFEAAAIGRVASPVDTVVSAPAEGAIRSRGPPARS